MLIQLFVDKTTELHKGTSSLLTAFRDQENSEISDISYFRKNIALKLPCLRNLFSKKTVTI